MRGWKNQRPLFYIVAGLIAVGILSAIAKNPGAFIITVIVFGGVFLLYKFPPDRWRALFRSAFQSDRMRTANRPRRVTKKAKFRVIPGSKPHKEDREPPRTYH